MSLKLRTVSAGIQYHHSLRYHRPGSRLEYDAYQPEESVAIETIGYRADDDVHEVIQKCDFHEGTHASVVQVPQWKWISGRRQETNYKATIKRLGFVDSYLSVMALVAVVYDWENAQQIVRRLAIIEGGGPLA